MSFVKHTSCPNCFSSDANAQYDTDTSYCFSCNKYTSNQKAEPIKDLYFYTGDCLAIPERKLNKSVVELYKYETAFVQQTGKIEIANYYNASNKLIAQKIRKPKKIFSSIGALNKLPLFGANLFKNEGTLVIAEGEIDALTIYQCLKNSFAVVSIPLGATCAEKAIKANLNYISKFSKIIFAFDMDEIGQKHARLCIDLLPHKQTYLSTFLHKDASETLLQSGAEAVARAIKQAKIITPEHIVSGSNIVSELRKIKITKPVPFPYEPLNKVTHGGMQKGELVTITAGTGTGKTTFIREMTYDLVNNKKIKTGLLMLEEPLLITAMQLTTLKKGKLTTPENTTITELCDYIEADFTELSDNLCLYNHIGCVHYETLLQNIRYLVISNNCEFIFIDHISMLVSYLDSSDERKAIDKIMSQLKALAIELNIVIVLVSHLSRADSKLSHEDGGNVSIAHLRGSHSIAQLSNIVIALERNQQDDEEKDIVRLRILKNRKGGVTGVCTTLFFNNLDSRLK